MTVVGHKRVLMMFKLNFAPHLGFPTPATPLFSALAASVDPVDQMRFAAANGFRAVQDPFACERTPEEQARIGEAAAELSLTMGCFVFAPLAEALTPMWTSIAPENRAKLSQALEEAMAVAERNTSRHIAVFTGLDPDRPASEQRRAMVENLAWAGEIAAARDFKICIEPVNARRLPNMLLNHIADGIEVARDAANSSVRLIFDFAHVQAMDGDILYHLDQAWEMIEIVQIADNPDRVEPCAGELNFVRLIDELVARNFSGLCELEHRWSSAEPQVQSDYLAWLERWRA